MRNAKNLNPDAAVPAIEIAGFAVGGAAGNFMSTLLGSFLLVYYTNVVGIGAAAVATVMGISKIFDGFSDLVAGYIIDRTHSKWGKCRPWQIRMVLPFAVCMLLMFWVPAGIPSAVKIAYIFITYNLVNTVCLTILSVSHAALNGCMSLNQKSRGINGGMLMILAIIAGILMNSTLLQITSAVGGGDPYTQKGWTVMILVYLAVFVVMEIFGFLFTTERVTISQRKQAEQNEEKEYKKEEKKSEVKVLEALKILIHDKYWVIFVIVMICVIYNQTSLGMSNVYFAQYVLGDVFYYTPLGNCQSIGSLAGAVIALVLMVKFSKRNLCSVGLCFCAIGALMPFISLNISWLYVASSLKGFGSGVAACVLPGMLQDSITYGIWQSGKDVLGMGNAAYSFCNKLGASLGTILLGFLLQAGGFDGALAVQPAGALMAIKTLYIWVPGIAMVLSVIAMAFYDLDKKYEKIAMELKERMGIKEEY